jgi:fatty-acyl-CoA synthase
VSVTDRVQQKLFTARTLARAGVVKPTRPDRIARAVQALHRFGPTPAAGYTISAIRFPGETAIIDDLGTVTFAEVHRRSNALAHELRAAGVGEGDGVAIMCRNHRGFVDTTVALSKLGAHSLYLNTAFAGPQITEVAEREQPAAIVYDAEFENLLHDAGRGRKRFIAWHDAGEPAEDPRLEDLIARGDPSDLDPPSAKGRVVILTSGTTGSPKGAQRRQPESLDPAAALFDMIPLRAREKTMLAAPMFHSWGFAHFTLGMALSSTLVMRRKFDPEDTLSTMAQHQTTALIVVPVMLQRILELPPETIDRYDLSALRVIAASGSALPGELAHRVMDRFGDVLYNLYGSTEVAWATIATPTDLREAPGTAGRPPRGTVVKLLDEDGLEVRPGETGRIFVGNEMAMDGYTGGGGKQVVGGLMSSGDLGHLDGSGRLFVAGRDDEMIVSGGENVFPREVEDLLAAHDAVCEVAVVGVDDEEFGQRLRAFVVVHTGREPNEDELKDHVKATLARYKVPREIVFVEELPRNATGKVLKRELVAREK